MDFEKSILAAGQTDTSFTVYSANINKDNKGLSDLKNELKAINPDIVLLMEVSPKHFEELDSVKLSYPYSVENVQNGLLGVVFLSRFPVRNHQFTKLSDFGNLLLEAMLDIDQTTVMFYGIHAQRPDRGDFNERKRQFYGPAEQIRDKSLPAIVAGDFNATPFSPLFRELVRIAELKDSREGFGWQPSWPSFFPLLWIPIDHVLVTPDFQVRKRSTGSHIGSDHYPVIAELSLG